MKVRPERPTDLEAIREVNRQAFGTEAEGRLVDRLRAEGQLLLSLVAEVDEFVEGAAGRAAELAEFVDHDRPIMPTQPAGAEEAGRGDGSAGRRGELAEFVDHDRPIMPTQPAGRIVGHIAFSLIHCDGREVLSLAPMAVLPAFQRQGIGSALVRAGLAAVSLPVVVLGHPAYYPRFGFRAEHAANLRCAWSGPALMATEPLSGELVYPPAFSEV